MKVDFRPYALEFRFPFGLSHSKRTHTANIYLRLQQDGFTAYGEAVFPPYLSPSQEESLQKLSEIKWPMKVQALTPHWIQENIGHNYPLRAAVEMASYSLKKQLGIGQKIELSTLSNKPISTYTISLGSASEIDEKLKYANGFDAIKIKLGTDLNKDYILRIIEKTQRPFCVDVNQGWTDLQKALDNINWLAEQGCFLIEQPLSKENFKGHYWLKQHSPIPIIADESCQTLTDIYNCANAFDGINIKLMKCGGIGAAAEMISIARAKGLKTIIGCMSGSSVAINAGKELANYSDWVDLDGNVLIKNDPDPHLLFSNSTI